MSIHFGAYYFFHFATLGIFIPFLGLYLNNLAFSPVQIGAVIGATFLTKVLAPLSWDKGTHSRYGALFCIQRANILAALILSLLFVTQSFAGVLLIISLYCFVWNATLPIIEARAVAQLGLNNPSYSRTRLWGSVGFIATVLGSGVFLAYFPTQSLLYLLVGCALAQALVLWLGPNAAYKRAVEEASLRGILACTHIRTFMICAFLMQLSHGPYYGFYSLYMAQHGYATQWVSFLWVFAVLMEIVLFLVAPKWIKAERTHVWFQLCFAAAALRWLVVAFWPESLTLMLIAQAGHALTFAAFHLCAMHTLHSHLKAYQHSKAQALYSSFTFGLGAGLGSLLSGGLWALGSPSATWLCASALSLAVFVFLVRTKALSQAR